MNAHIVRFGREIEEARGRLLDGARRGECRMVHAYLALYGGMALMRDGIETLHSTRPDEAREAL